MTAKPLRRDMEPSHCRVLPRLSENHGQIVSGESLNSMNDVDIGSGEKHYDSLLLPVVRKIQAR